ncbi:two pore domain potassium channel family protein [Halomonas sp. TRM85114]|uniref:ion channel n=1 Tax=Halomonas jincaotanensis TaxID=2810616 RepID=UPI001BD3BCB6|nr:ion channel [Halomonas jincaotanensis]MBS9404613.1 two pore domain potassium channel family protein [Halomonas jincaotanensis]
MLDATLRFENLMTAAVTLAVFVCCVSLHYEASIRLSRHIETSKRSLRWRFLVLMSGIFVTHVAEIWLFAGGAALLLHVPAAGNFTGGEPRHFLDLVYVSTMAYSSLGYDKLSPEGPIRFLFGTEGLLGFMMITWSASLTFLKMQNHWAV